MAYEEKKSATSPDSAEEPAATYEIRVKDCLDVDFWAEWVGGLGFSIEPGEAETILRGPIGDQAELYGMLSQLRNKGLALISVRQIERGSGPSILS